MNWFIVIAISLPPILLVIQQIYRTLPNYNETLILSSILGEITINRSAEGIPEIKASTLEDVFFAFGYTHAQDRLWQMDILRRTAQGTLSEFLGKSALEKDIFSRNLQFRNNAKKLCSLSPKAELMLKRYSEGINTYAELHYLPIEYFLTWNKWKRWEPLDTLALWRYLSFIINVDMQSDLLRSELVSVLGSSLDLMPIENQFDEYSTVQKNELPRELYKTFEHSKVQDSEKGGLGTGMPSFIQTSNAWVVSGLFTKSGKPIIASDPHLMSFAPSLIYLSSANWKNHSLYGASIPGLPILLSGSNEKLSWGSTALTSDTMDLYSHRISGSKYFYSGKPQDFSSFSEEIRIKSENPVVINFLSTNSGPLLYNKGNLSIRWAADEVSDTSFDGFLQLISATSSRSVRIALEKVVIPALGIVYGNEEGDIGYQAVGVHPAKDFIAVGVVNGESLEKRWKGFIRYEELPYVINPPKGFIVAANNRPAAYMYKHYRSIGSEFAEGRAARIDFLIEALIDSKKKIDVKDMLTVQLDQFSHLAYSVLPTWLKLANNPQASRIFSSWNCELSKSSVQAAVFISWFRHFGVSVLPPHLSPSQAARLINSRLYRSHLAKLSESNSLDTLCGSLCGSFLSSSFSQALKEVGDKTWGELHRARNSHLPFSSIGYLRSYFELSSESGGSDTTINSRSFTWSSDYTSDFGSEARLIFDLGSFPSSLWSLSTGISGNILSPFYTSLHLSFSSGVTQPLLSTPTHTSILSHPNPHKP